MATLSATSTSSSTSSSSTYIELKRTLIPPKWEDSVRVVGMSECREAALSLAHAFATDELALYLLGSDNSDGPGPGPGAATNLTPEDKWRLHVEIMTYIVAAHCLNGVVTAIGADYDGVALWMPPGRNLDDWWTVLRSGMWRLWFRLGAEGRRRYYEEMLPLLHRTKEEVLGPRDADSWYLVYIGTKPSARGRGCAKKLIQHMLQRADLEKRAVYLESSASGNIPYYKKFGFEKQKDIFLTRAKAPVPLSIMVREPQPIVKTSDARLSPMKQVGGVKAH